MRAHPMNPAKDKLISELHQLPGVEERPSPVAGASSLFFRGKEFAHFHHANELDLRLTRTVIRTLGLQHPTGSIHHPTRTPNSAWIEIRFFDDTETMALVELVKIAVTKL